MVARKRRRAPRKKLGTRLKQNPIGTAKSEFKKLGLVGQMAVIGIVAGATSVATASKLDKLPAIGPVFSIFTSWGRKYALKMK